MNNSRQRRCVYDKFELCPTLVAGMGEGGGLIPFVIVSGGYEPVGSIAIHNSKQFGIGFMRGVFKTLRAEKFDLGVVYEYK